MKIKEKILAVLMIIMLIGMNLITLGNQVIAANLTSQNSKTNNQNVEFDSYFEGNTYTKNFNIEQGATLYINLKIKNAGYLKEGIVRISDANYEIATEKLESEKVQSATENSISLKQIKQNEEVVLEVPIQIKKQETISTDYFSKTSTVEFEATYVDGNGNEKEISKTMNNQVIWQVEDELVLSKQGVTYVPYIQNGEYGVMVQTTLTSKLAKALMPISETELTMQVPQVNGQAPQRVTVVAKQITATGNNNTGVSFTSANYEYNQESGSLTIRTQNLENDMIAWNENGQDQYVINLFYVGEESYQWALENSVPVSMNINGKAILPDTNATVLEANSNIEENATKQDTLTQIDLNSNATLSKGTLYTKQETPYTTTYYAQVNDSSLTEKIQLQTMPSVFVDENNKEYTIGNQEKIKNITIPVLAFEKLLGQDGSIQIASEDGTTLGTINKESSKENENYTLDLSNSEVNTVMLTTTKPITEGILPITMEKVLTIQNYEKEQLESFSKITLGVTNQNKITQAAQNMQSTGNAEITEKTSISLTEPVSKAEIAIIEGKENLSTVVENKDVQIRIVLDTSSTENALYKNPTFEIELPEQVENIEIKDVNLFLEKELTLKEAKVVTKNGKKVIQITLEGTQTKYLDEQIRKTTQKNVITKGANIILNTDITLNDLATTATEQLIMYYTNENTNLYENPYTGGQSKARAVQAKAEKGVATTELNLVAPTGVIASNSMTGYNGTPSELTSISNQKQEAIIPTHSSKQEVTITGIITNNYSNPIENVMILGRLPFADNTNIETEESLGSNFAMLLKEKITTSGIDASKIKIYYSSNAKANKDLMNTANGWQENPQDLTSMKSYLIVVTGEVNSGAKLQFSYKVELPGNLAHNNSCYQMYQVSYDNKTQTATIGETKTSAILGLTTGQGSELEVTLSSNMEQNSNVPEGQIVRFFVQVKNIGNEEAKSVTINVPVPEGTIYTQYDSANQAYVDSNEEKPLIALGNLAVGETANATYELKMNQGTLGEIKHQVRVAAEDFTTGVASNEYVLNKVAAKMNLTLLVPRDLETSLHKGDILYSTILLESKETLNNVKVTIDIPAGIQINGTTYKDSNGQEQNYIQIQNNQVIVTIPQLQAGYLESISLQLQIQDFKGDFQYQAKAEASGMETHYSNQLIYHVGNPSFEITQTTTSERYIKEAEQITYEFTIKNTGDADANDVVFEDVLPEGLTFQKLEYTYQGQTEVVTSTLNNTAKVRWTNFEKGAEATVKVIAKADLLPEDKQDKTVTNVGSIEAQGTQKQESNAINTIIEYNPKLYEGESGNDGDNTNTPSGTYKITGTAWLDSNKNGQREETEQVLSGIQVMLLKKSNNEIVIDENGSQKIVTTADNGSYEFTGLQPDEYLVIFLYDAGSYTVTEYQKQGISQSYNSDVYAMKIMLNGKQTYAGVTDTISVTDGNVRDIDIGLIESQNFDLKLDKYISKITLTTPTIGTKVYNYNNEKLQKIEVLSQNIGKSSIVVEYKMVVTNEGQVPGYVKKIVDYLPEGAKFSSELNEDWYLSDENDRVYNTSLENVELQPGESKEVSLILSIAITDENIGTVVNNNAEIYEIYNEQGLTDIDSQEANSAQNEDDMSTADIVLSVVTGKIVLYISLTLAILFLLVIGIIVIKRNVLSKRREN